MEVKTYFGFRFKDLKIKPFNSKIYLAEKVKECKNIEQEKIKNLGIGKFCIVEQVPGFAHMIEGLKLSEFDYEEKIKNRITALSQLCENECFSNYLGWIRTKTKHFLFYEYDQKENFLTKYEEKKSWDKDDLQRFKDFVKAYKVLKDKKILHRIIRPEFIFIKNEQLKIVLFTFSCCSDEELKTTIKDHDHYYYYSKESNEKNKRYDIKLDIHFIGCLFFFMLFGVQLKNDESIKSIVEKKLETIKDLPIKKILRGCLEEYEEGKIKFDDLYQEVSNAWK